MYHRGSGNPLKFNAASTSAHRAKNLDKCFFFNYARIRVLLCESVRNKTEFPKVEVCDEFLDCTTVDSQAHKSEKP